MDLYDIHKGSRSGPEGERKDGEDGVDGYDRRPTGEGS